MAAQPFGGGQRHAQRENAQHPTGPQAAGERHTERGVKTQECRQTDHRERQQPAEGRRVDQKSKPDPI